MALRLTDTLVSDMIRVNEDPTTRLQVHMKAQPFWIFTAYKWAWDQFSNLMVQVEAMLYMDSKNNQVREQMTNYPNTPPPGERAYVETNIVSSRSTGAIITDQMRERDRQSIALSVLVWFPAIMIAFDEDARTEYEIISQRYEYTPTVLVEFIKKVRISICGIMDIYPTLDVTMCKAFIQSNPTLKNTFLDYDYLTSRSGLNDWMSLMQTLQSSPGNYIAFSSISEIKGVKINSGTTTTFCALNVINTTLNGVVQVLPSHSFGNTLPAVHIVDAYVIGLQAFNYGTRNPLTFTGIEQFIFTVSFRSFATHLVHRCVGLQKNPSSQKTGSDKPKTKQKASKTTSVETTEQMGNATLTSTASTRSLIKSVNALMASVPSPQLRLFNTYLSYYLGQSDGNRLRKGPRPSRTQLLRR